MNQSIVDSTGMLELVLFIEETFGIAVVNDELRRENFDSITALADFVERKTAQSPMPVAS
jgi:acyl carrier protein